MKMVNFIVLLLVVIGALNWGMIGFFKINVITLIFSELASRIIFAVIGLCGLWSLLFFKYLDYEKPNTTNRS